MTLRQSGQLLLLSAIWGSMFLLVKYALVDFAPVEVAFLQALVGALGLFVVVNIEGGQTRAKLRDILHRPGSALLLGALSAS
jgi:drug/metabolite transporter (DMT)-like permease